MFFLGATANIFAYLLASSFLVACLYCNLAANHQKIINEILPVREISAETQHSIESETCCFYFDCVEISENIPVVKTQPIHSDDFRDIYLYLSHPSYYPGGEAMRAPPLV